MRQGALPDRNALKAWPQADFSWAVLDACKKGPLRWRNSQDGEPDVWNVSFWLWLDPYPLTRSLPDGRSISMLMIVLKLKKVPASTRSTRNSIILIE